MFAIVVPYRNREAHLRKFIEHYSEVMPDVPIYVVEQMDDKHFNRAKLFNAFYLIKGHEYMYCCYHDVDMRVIPELSDKDLFEYPINPTHIGSRLQQFNPKKRPEQWSEVYPEFFGGVCLISRGQMENSNGWSNEIYSWGIEDDEMRQNLVSCGYKIDRRQGYFRCEDHERLIIPEEFEKNKNYLLKGRSKSDGLSNCRYELVSIEQKQGYIHVKVIL